MWEYPVFIQNCAANFANLSTFEKIDALLVVSSSLTNINEKKMSDLITNYNDVFEQARNTTEVSLKNVYSILGYKKFGIAVIVSVFELQHFGSIKCAGKPLYY